MGGGFRCPKCKEWNSCDCKTCKPNPTNGPLMITDREEDSAVCGVCGESSCGDAWMNQAWDDACEIMDDIRKNEQVNKIKNINSELD